MNGLNNSLLFDYASGSLSEPLALAVATHRALSPAADRVIRSYESYGGVLLEKECEPVMMSESALDMCLARIDGQNNNVPSAFEPIQFDGVTLPHALSRYITSQNVNLVWHSAGAGMQYIDLGADGATHIRLLKIAPNITTPDHGHKGMEVTVLLDGAFDDVNDRYVCGDMIVEDVDSVHAPVADPQIGCMCLVVTTAPIRLTGLLGKFINPFLK